MPESQFIGDEIEVEQAPASPRPVRFTWRGTRHEIAQVMAERVDTGYGDHPPRSRRWFTRRHRRYFVVKDSAGEVFEMYLDYSDKRQFRWFLTKRVS